MIFSCRFNNTLKLNSAKFVFQVTFFNFTTRRVSETSPTSLSLTTFTATVMGRRKQSQPHRSVGISIDNHSTSKEELDAKKAPVTKQVHEKYVYVEKPYYVDIDKTNWASNEHHDISEVVLTNLDLRKDFTGFRIHGDFYKDTKFNLRFRVCNMNEFIPRIKLGHWPVLSSSDVSLELIEKCTMEGVEKDKVIFSGSFDGPNEGLSGLVHLASLKFLALRPVLGPTFSNDFLSLRVRVEILNTAFDACESLLDNTRQLWGKSMMNVMAWLRPEVITSEARYGVSTSAEIEIDLLQEMEDCTSNSRRRAMFDVAGFYEAIKPSKEMPLLTNDIPDLLPVLRPYQLRAAYWMVQREKGDFGSLDENERNQFLYPLCMPVDFLDTDSKMFYNPFSGNVSLHMERSSAYVLGGILADEMGLGKTVEVLACIFAHPKPPSEGGVLTDTVVQVAEDQKILPKRAKTERVECICGAVSESRKYKGLWVQCDVCDAWQHADCVGYAPRGKARKANGREDNKSTDKSQKRTGKKDRTNIIERDGEYICQLCSKLIEASISPVATGATLIICPASILRQWHAEIMRHTRPGSLKTYVYDGVRSTSLSNTTAVDISELVSADIVLTTYDVLKEDLSHDSDRHVGVRHFLRYEKRYPVVPTLLTRIYWWRICLDEAQMVESNAAAATEMAMRLYSKHCWCITGTPIQRKLDDLSGLLRFLKASPFNVSRWWIDVIRDPYERRDRGAMEFTHKFFKQLMWRSSKLHIADELQLPPQEECFSWLTFSPIEEHFYQRQHETCVSYACEVIESLKDDILKRKVPGCVSSDTASDTIITHAEAAKLLNSLLKLRQACCHPQVGSYGLRSLQQNPMTMDEILEALIDKTKTEGEEALRMIVVAVNGLAAIAIIKNKLSDAVLLYKEALDLTEEHKEDFRLDPLLNIHIHHNLAEIIPMVTNCSEHLPSEKQLPGTYGEVFKLHSVEKCGQNASKRQKVSVKDDSDFAIDAKHIPTTSGLSENGVHGHQQCDEGRFSDKFLRMECENLEKKYLSLFSSKLSVAQQEFRKSYMQVCTAINESKDEKFWWLEPLNYAEQDKDFSSELIKKIEDAIAGSLNSSMSSQISTRFRSISSLKYHIQTGLELLEACRETLLNRLLEIDQTMEKPKEEDIERVRYCRYCYAIDDGPTCIHCDLDELFKAYEARIFRLNKLGKDSISSAEEAIELQKRTSERNRYLSQQTKSSISSSVGNKEFGKRKITERVLVSKSASELEIVLGVIKSYCKAQLGRDGMLAATKQINNLEGMRKEYSHARSLAIAQAQFLHAHDELKMATSRLHLRENENDKTIDALSPNELDSASVVHTNEKFMSMTLLSSIKGKLRYLKGLMQSSQKSPSGSSDTSLLSQEMTTLSTSEQTSEGLPKADEACPICQERLSNQKMVFQCGHLTCCKCLFAMTEKRLHDGQVQHKWIMCPICRQPTDVGNIAYVDERQNRYCNSSMAHTVQGCELSEASLTVQGSYGTKIEAVTRRILWIKFADPKAKVLVFSSWNDVLDMLEHAFAANDITYIRMKGGRKSHLAISEFREQKSGAKTTRKRRAEQSESSTIQVLLILIQHGANGLNLLEAQHVVLVEPLLNPAVEAQAISRVHRIGQENKTFIHRFVVKNTVEESIYKLNRSRNNNSFISGNTNNKDQPLLTLKDVESLFSVVPPPAPESEEKPTESLRHLPPSMAAAIAAERRLKEQTLLSL